LNPDIAKPLNQKTTLMKILTPSVLVVLCVSFFAFHAAGTDPDPRPVKSELLLQTTTAWNGNSIEYPRGEAEITALHIEIEPGAETGWHHHPVPSFAYILQGTLEVTLESGESELVTGGEAIAEVFNTVHNGRNVGDDTVKLVVFYTGIVDGNLTIMNE
jgi:quercetin dioxygenase-like cupin family protein